MATHHFRATAKKIVKMSDLELAKLLLRANLTTQAAVDRLARKLKRPQSRERPAKALVLLNAITNM